LHEVLLDSTNEFATFYVMSNFLQSNQSPTEVNKFAVAAEANIMHGEHMWWLKLSVDAVT
jgi:hypothetical protein